MPLSASEGAALRLLDGEPTHHGEAVGIAARGLQGEIVAVALPRRRHDYGAVDARFVHFAQQVVGDPAGVRAVITQIFGDRPFEDLDREMGDAYPELRKVKRRVADVLKAAKAL